MSNPPRIWLNYRPVRIGWVISNEDVQQLGTAATLNACLWGGRHNCIIPAHDTALAERLIECFGVDVLMPTRSDAETTAFIGRIQHLQYKAGSDTIFQSGLCEFADISHVLRRITANVRIALPKWDASDALHPLLTLLIGRYPTRDANIPDYKGAIQNAFGTVEFTITPTDEIPLSLLEFATPVDLTGYDLIGTRYQRDWRLSPGVVVGSAADFEALATFWNLRAAGAQVIFYDQAHGARLKTFANAYLEKLRGRSLSKSVGVNIWIGGDRPLDDDWKPDLEFGDLPIFRRNRRSDVLWSPDLQPATPHFPVGHRNVVPSYAETVGEANASFALPDRPFSDNAVRELNQRYTVVVDVSPARGPDAQLTFATPFVRRLNEFYGRNFHYVYNEARSQPDGSVALITSIAIQQLNVTAFRVFDWMKEFFRLCRMDIVRSEPGLRCSRLITQLGGLDGCRVLKIRGVRALLRKYRVDESFTRSGAMEAIRDVDAATKAVGFDAFKDLHIEFREHGDLRPDDVLRYLLERRVFRVGLELTCPNCQLPSWVHLDELKSRSICGYCDYSYDVTPQLKDRDWRYRRSGIFGREDDQLGGVPVALTLQQLASSLHQSFVMYSTAMSFRSAGAAIEPCESDFVGIISGARRTSDPLVQIIFGEAKTEHPFDAQDVHKLGMLADAVPRDLAEVFILFSKTGTFSLQEILMAKGLNSNSTPRVILWSRDELEPFDPYGRSLGKTAGTLTDMANITQSLYFS